MLLELNDITKKFGEAEVLKGINLPLEAGEIRGLVGENGAGKSTTMNILGGIHPPSSGSMRLNGAVFAPQSPTDSLAAGIAFIHQELNLFPNLSILENLFLSHFPQKKILGIPVIDRQAARQQAQKLLQQVALDLNPATLVEELTPAQRQLLEIAKALSANPRIIIFDEPTTSLTSHETRKLFDLMARLKADNIAMIYISHNLQDVMHLCDHISVLRDGRLISDYNQAAGYHLPTIINDMVGRDIEQFFPDRNTAPGTETLLEVKSMHAEGVVHDISFTVKKKEILGFYGLVGAGRSEMARIIYGLDAFASGALYWKQQPISAPTPARWINKRVAFLTEDRREEGLLLAQPIGKNIALASLRRFVQSPLRWVARQPLQAAVSEQAEATKIKYHSLTTQPVATLSGGNQQKVVLAKWLMTKPELLIMDEPTKGIDINAKHEIYKLIHQLTEQGAGVLLISSEIEELLGLCDRILVMKQGRISAGFSKAEFDRSALLEAALHTEKQGSL
ncbi:MAG: sugar ABC transporter ATP-binding protein [Cyclobacteriaceae bacterium]